MRSSSVGRRAVRARRPLALEPWEEGDGSDEATWMAHRLVVTGQDQQGRGFMVEIDRWRWPVVIAVARRSDVPSWQDAEDGFSTYVRSLCLELAAGRMPEQPGGVEWFRFLVRRSKDRVPDARTNHLPVSPTEVAAEAGDESVVLEDRRTPSPWRSAADHESLELLLSELRRALVGARGSETLYRVLSARAQDLDYAEISRLLRKSPSGCRVALVKAVRRVMKERHRWRNAS